MHKVVSYLRKSGMGKSRDIETKKLMSIRLNVQE